MNHQSGKPPAICVAVSSTTTGGGNTFLCHPIAAGSVSFKMSGGISALYRRNNAAIDWVCVILGKYALCEKISEYRNDDMTCNE